MEAFRKLQGQVQRPLIQASVFVAVTVFILCPWGLRNLVSGSVLAAAFLGWVVTGFGWLILMSHQEDSTRDRNDKDFLEQVLENPALVQHVWVVTSEDDSSRGVLYARTTEGTTVMLAGASRIFTVWPRLQAAGIAVLQRPPASAS